MARTKIFTAYEKADLAELSDRTVLVREGFTWLAFLFGPLWLLLRGLWVATLGYVLLLGALLYVAQTSGATDVALMVLQAFVQLILGFSATDLIRESLKRRGYVFKGVIVADSALGAERRYHDCMA